jgi:hypothetical protein
MSEQILYDNWQKSKRNSESALKKWNEKRTELLRYGNATPYQLVKQVKAYREQYYNLKTKEKDAEILYLRCKNIPKNIPPALKLESDLDLEPPPK